MAWLREHDAELQDPKVARLTGDEYRELHALRQYVAKEHPGPAGLFSREELPFMTFPTTKAPRVVRARTFARFLELRLVRSVESYTPAELLELSDGPAAWAEAAEEIGNAVTDELELYRCNRWEAYAAPLDRTRNERQARYRAGREERRRRKGFGSATGLEGEGNAVTNAPVTPSVSRASIPSRPVPVTSPSTSEVDGEGSDDLDFGELSRSELPPGLASLELDPARELDVVRLLGAVGSLEPAQADMLRGYASRAPEAVLARIRERLLEGDVRDRYAYALGTLRRELESGR